MQRRPPAILVVDDTPSAQHDTLALLRRRDYSVSCAWTLAEAHERCGAEPIDLVIAGNRIGSMSGLQFILSCRSRRPEVAGMLVVAQPEHVPEMDAWRHGITGLVRPLEPDHFLMVVAEKLAGVRPRQRWPRKKVDSYVALQIGAARARLLDVSYGGLRFQLEGDGFDLKPVLQIEIPVSRLRVDAELVWSARAPDGSCQCGAMLTGDDSVPRPSSRFRWAGLDAAIAGLAAPKTPAAAGLPPRSVRTPPHAWRAFVDRVS